jgi:hypothetical protein
VYLSCLLGYLHCQVEITGAEVAVECRAAAAAGVQLPSAERCEQPPRGRGRARGRAGEAGDLLGEVAAAGAVQKFATREG